MKIMTILGTRPEIIRLNIIIKKLDRLCDHILVNTGQNYEATLNEIFFSQLDIRQPNHFMGIRADTFGEQIGRILIESERIMDREMPDRILLLGDTNSALSAIIAKRMGFPVYHMEAGNRCYDDRVPEEVNRRIIDHSSDVLMPYTERSRMNLLREGIPGHCIFVVGNPIYEVLQSYAPMIQMSTILRDLALEERKYVLVTVHRAENVDISDRLASIMEALDKLQKEYQIPVIVSTHPHTKERLRIFGIKVGNKQVRFLQPFGFFDFIALEEGALCVLSDSGTVQEECAIFGRPSVTIRDVTERPETIECGSNILSGVDPEQIMTCVRIALNRKGTWSPPREYLVENVSDTVINILLGYHHPYQ